LQYWERERSKIRKALKDYGHEKKRLSRGTVGVRRGQLGGIVGGQGERSRRKRDGIMLTSGGIGKALQARGEKVRIRTLGKKGERRHQKSQRAGNIEK